MTTFTELVAAVVVHSSAAAYSHFGVTLEPAQVERPAPIERIVARTVPKGATLKAIDCAPAKGRALKT